MAEVARVLGHDGQVLTEMAIEGPLPVLRIPVSPRLRDLLKPADPDALIPFREVRAVYEQTADDGTRIYRVRIDL